MGWSKKYKRSIDCSNPKGFSQKAHCAGRKKKENVMSSKLEELVGKRLTEEQFDEAAGKKDACYHKVKARYDVWPSAYASGALVKCRKVGAKNWGNKSKKEGVNEFRDTPTDAAEKQTLKNPKTGKEVTVRSIMNQGTKKYPSTLVKKANAIYKKALEKEQKARNKFHKDRTAKYSFRGGDYKREGVNEAGMELNKLKDAIKMFQKKIEKQGRVTNARDEEHLSNLIKLYKQMGGKGVKEGLDDLQALPKDLKKSIKKNRKEGLGDKFGKTIDKYNKKRKKNMDALKKLKKEDKAKVLKLLIKRGNNPQDAKSDVEKLYNKVSKMYKNASNSKKAEIISALSARMESVNEARGTCWVGYQQVGMKKKGGKMVPNCVKEIIEIYYEQNGEGHGYTFEHIKDLSLNEAEYQGRKVKLGKIMQGDTKKFKVYVKNPKGNVVKVNFGQGGKAKGGTMRIRKSNAAARKSFRARHNCDNPGPRHKARYWSCRKW